MNREQIIEAMARAVRESKHSNTWGVALDALCEAIPGLADVISGESVIVPVGPSDGVIAVNADDNGNVDEAIARDCLFHLERMSDNCWFIGITFKDGSSHAFWLGREKRSVNVILHEARPK